MARTIVHTGRKIQVSVRSNRPDGRPIERDLVSTPAPWPSCRWLTTTTSVCCPSRLHRRRNAVGDPGRHAGAGRGVRPRPSASWPRRPATGRALAEADRILPVAGRAQRADAPVRRRGADSRGDAAGGRREDRAARVPWEQAWPGRWTARSATPRRWWRCCCGTVAIRTFRCRRRTGAVRLLRSVWSAADATHFNYPCGQKRRHHLRTDARPHPNLLSI